MHIIKNQTILQRQSENYIKGELSNVASVLQTPQILTEYFTIDVDASTTMTGFNNVEDYIGPTSTVRYGLIHSFPMSGIDSLVTQSQFDEELGFEEDFQSSGITFPNTVMPKPHDLFLIKSSAVQALYVVTTIMPVTVRSNPFIEISFRLYTRDPDKIAQLYKQVHEEYETTITAIGMDKSLVIKKSSLFDIQHHVDQYLDIADLYRTLFYDRNKAAFVFDGLPGVDGGGCMGYICQGDLQIGTGNNTNQTVPPGNLPDITQLTNGATINERGDKFYVVEGDPIVVPSYIPYWLVRNHTSRFGEALNNQTCCQCATCQNQTCANYKVGLDYTDPNTGQKIVRQVFIDMTLWKLLFDEGIVIYDDVVTYANNNFTKSVERLYTDCPDIYIDEHFYKRSVLYRILTRDHKHNPAEFCHPQCSEADTRIAKFQGKNIYYLDYYDNTRSCLLNTGYYNIWDSEFQERLASGELYPICDQDINIAKQCLKKVYPFNVYLRNAIIAGYNQKPIDWDGLALEYERTIENYTLIPLLLGFYKEHIRDLQK